MNNIMFKEEEEDVEWTEEGLGKGKKEEEDMEEEQKLIKTSTPGASRGLAQCHTEQAACIQLPMQLCQPWTSPKSRFDIFDSD